ncbi:MAG TPA: hypothetical protein G4N95_09315 [Anaerolineae bacterium]|nr:hypothetical protein [Anaerolineae bacterium]
MNNKIKILSGFLVFIIGVLNTGCNNTLSEQSIPLENTKTNIQVYPPPKEYKPTENPYPSPVITQAGYPVPEVMDDGNTSITITPFKLDKPIYEGDTKISGKGPINVPIILLDITFMGEYLGQTITNENGIFNITVEPLEASHRIGIMLGPLEGTEWESFEFDQNYYGNEARNIPLVGFFYDTALIIDKSK